MRAGYLARILILARAHARHAASRNRVHGHAAAAAVVTTMSAEPTAPTHDLDHPPGLDECDPGVVVERGGRMNVGRAAIRGARNGGGAEVGAANVPDHAEVAAEIETVVGTAADHGDLTAGREILGPQ